MENDCHYIPPEEVHPQEQIFDQRNSYSEVWVGVPQEVAEVVAPAYLVDREVYDRLWNEQRIANRRHNLELYPGNLYKQSGRPTR